MSEQELNESPQEHWGQYSPTLSTLIYRILICVGLSRGSIRKWIWKKWKRHSSIVDIKIRGIKYRLNIRRNTTDGKILTSSKIYDKKELLQLIPKTKTDGVFLDIGANTGYYSLNLASHYSRIIAIEPYPPTLKLLRYNVAINELDHIINIVPLCIGEGGQVAFHCKTGFGSAGILKGDASKGEVINVDSSSLLDIVNSLSVTSVSAMKIDIEGHEDQALKPFFEKAKKSLWPKIVIMEDCHQDLWKTDIIEYMKSIGYKKKQITPSNAFLELI